MILHEVVEKLNDQCLLINELTECTKLETFQPRFVFDGLKFVFFAFAGVSQQPF